jgi:hypothetical protein
VIARIAPPALGRDFRWLWAQATITNLGDGMLLAAGPLLVTTITREPFAVAASVFLQQLPWVLFGIPAGAIIDRVDRRRLTIGVCLRGATCCLSATIPPTTDIWVIFLTVFLRDRGGIHRQRVERPCDARTDGTSVANHGCPVRASRQTAPTAAGRDPVRVAWLSWPGWTRPASCSASW